MAFYHCTNCGFTFKREGKPEQCPDCGKPEVRAALKAEIAEFEKLQKDTQPKNKE